MDEFSDSMDDSENNCDFDSDGYGFSCAESSPPPQKMKTRNKTRKKSKSDGNIPSSRHQRNTLQGGRTGDRQVEDTRVHWNREKVYKRPRRGEEQGGEEYFHYYSDGHWIAEDKWRRAEQRRLRRDHYSDGPFGLDVRPGYEGEERRRPRRFSRSHSTRSRHDYRHLESDNSASEEEEEEGARAGRWRGHRGQGDRKVSSTSFSKTSNAGLSFRRWPIKRRWTLDKECAYKRTLDKECSGKKEPRGSEDENAAEDIDGQVYEEKEDDANEKSAVETDEEKPNKDEDRDREEKEDKSEAGQEEPKEAAEGKVVREGEVENVEEVKEDAKAKEANEASQAEVEVHKEEEEVQGKVEEDNPEGEEKKEEDVDKNDKEAGPNEDNKEEVEEEEEEGKKDEERASSATSSSSSSSSEEPAKGPRRGSLFLPLSRSVKVGKKSFFQNKREKFTKKSLSQDVVEFD